MYYSNYDYENLENGGKERKYILYVNTIGSEADKAVNQIFIKLGLQNPKVKKTRYGNLNATKYSFELADEMAIKIMISSMRGYIINIFSDVTFLRENRNNIYIINRVKYL